MPYQHTIQQVRETLTSTFNALDTWFEQPADVRAYHPNDGGWCIDEILEHITLTSHFLMLVIRTNTQKAIKRAAVQPRADAESDQQRECLAILEALKHGEGSLVTVRMSVQNLGKIDLYQWLCFLALHAKRHHTEIERIYGEYKS